MRFARFAALAAAAIVLSACADFDSIHRTFKLSDNESQLVDVKQRAIFVETNPLDPQRHIVCPEPSPDALSVYAASVAAQGGKIPLSISGSSSESGEAFGLRTQTIQTQRDEYTAMCLAYLSGAVDKYEYGYMLRRYADQMVAALAIEQLTTAIRPQIEPISATAGTTTTNSTNTTSTSQSSTTAPAAPAPAAPAPAAPAATTPAAAKMLSPSPLPNGIIEASYTADSKDESGGDDSKPSCTLTAKPTSVAAGKKATLSWTSAKATSLTIDQKVGDAKAADVAKGSSEVTVKAATTYKATVTDDAGNSNTCTVKVAITGKSGNQPEVKDDPGTGDPKTSDAAITVAAAVYGIANDVFQQDYATQMCFAYFQKYEDDANSKIASATPGSAGGAKSSNVSDTAGVSQSVNTPDTTKNLGKFCNDILVTNIQARMLQSAAASGQNGPEVYRYAYFTKVCLSAASLDADARKSCDALAEKLAPAPQAQRTASAVQVSPVKMPDTRLLSQPFVIDPNMFDPTKQ